MDPEGVFDSRDLIPYSGEDYLGAFWEAFTGRMARVPEVPLPGGFTVPLSPFDRPIQLRAGNVTIWGQPTLTEQVSAAIYGQNTGHGALGLPGLPSPLDSMIRTHTSAELSLIYRNLDDPISRWALGVIHPGLPERIDSEDRLHLGQWHAAPGGWIDDNGYQRWGPPPPVDDVEIGIRDYPGSFRDIHSRPPYLFDEEGFPLREGAANPSGTPHRMEQKPDEDRYIMPFLYPEPSGLVGQGFEQGRQTHRRLRYGEETGWTPWSGELDQRYG